MMRDDETSLSHYAARKMGVAQKVKDAWKKEVKSFGGKITSDSTPTQSTPCLLPFPGYGARQEDLYSLLQVL